MVHVALEAAIRWIDHDNTTDIPGRSPVDVRDIRHERPDVDMQSRREIIQTPEDDMEIIIEIIREGLDRFGERCGRGCSGL